MKIRKRHYNRGSQSIYRRNVISKIMTALDIRKSNVENLFQSGRRMGKTTTMHIHLEYTIKLLTQLKARIGTRSSAAILKRYL